MKNDEIIRFQRQKVVQNEIIYSILSGVLAALIYVLIICCIMLSYEDVYLDHTGIYALSGCVLLIWLTTMTHILIDFRWAKVTIEDDKIRVFNGYYLIPIRIPIEAIRKIQPVANRRLFTHERLGLRLLMKGKWRWLPYPIDLYLADENHFIGLLQQINPTIDFTEEVILARRITI